MTTRRFFPRRLRRPLVPIWLGALLWLGTLLALTVPPATVGEAPWSTVPPTSDVQSAPAASLSLRSTAAVLMDDRSGQILYSHNPHLVWPPASTTKIMTALVALESLPPDALIEISPAVARFRQGSCVGLPAGARIPLRDLLYGLMLHSGNDAALAIAEGVAGTVPAFVALMNDEAQRLGARDTHFTSPHGLYNPGHYSSAHDLAIITREAMQDPTFREIVKTKRWLITFPGKKGSRMLWNHNRLLSRYPGADGVKTGYIYQAGQTLVASATRDGWRLIAVVLHSGDLWGDATRLLSYGFSHFRSLELARPGEELATVEVPGAQEPVPGVVTQSVFGALALGEVATPHVTLLPHLAPPLRRGERVGGVRFYASGRLVGAAPFVAAKDVKRQGGLVQAVAWVGRVMTEFVRGAVQ